VPIADAPRGRKPVHVRHADVEEDERGVQLLDGPERILAGRRAAEPAEAGRGDDDLADDLEEEGLIVHAEDTDLLVRRGAHDRSLSSPAPGRRRHPVDLRDPRPRARRAGRP
jgi:hypothetical protein